MEYSTGVPRDVDSTIMESPCALRFGRAMRKEVGDKVKRQQNGVGDKQSLGRISLGTKLILGRTSNEMSSRFMGLPRD
uniref:Uncharacterized protein n=1 Tax=Vespula pensylvanica TaxID=30213 RepID=A0A834JY94_VESPE|nr:hypothetical protein H0235_016400 [Vespula pensylvanica]